ncbi:MAG: hypothetical protein QGG40_05730, partial [Myxococcota bacterium]|jgi:hypothetical protein|nr:hypothetical protein [Myxococcota bacterium]
VCLAWPGHLRTRGPWKAGLVGVLLYLPNALWNLQRDGVSWRFQWEHVSGASSSLSFLGAQVGLVGPVLFLVFVAWWLHAWRGDRIDRLLWWTSFPVLILATTVGGEANWGAVAYVGVACGVARATGRWNRVAWAGVGVSALLSTVVHVHAQHPLFDLPKDPIHRTVGGRELGEAVAAWGLPNVVTSRYQEAALIHFYGGVPAQALPGHGRPDQYDLWARELAPHGLYVRVWSARDITAMEERGFQRGQPNVVQAYAHTTDPLAPTQVGAWQVYTVSR